MLKAKEFFNTCPTSTSCCHLLPSTQDVDTECWTHLNRYPYVQIPFSSNQRIYKVGQAWHSPQQGWIWHPPGPVCSLLTAEFLHQSLLWCQPERWLLLHHSCATFSHGNSGSQFLHQCEMTAPVYEHLVTQASQQAPDQTLPSHL